MQRRTEPATYKQRKFLVDLTGDVRYFDEPLTVGEAGRNIEAALAKRNSTKKMKESILNKAVHGQELDPLEKEFLENGWKKYGFSRSTIIDLTP